MNQIGHTTTLDLLVRKALHDASQDKITMDIQFGNPFKMKMFSFNARMLNLDFSNNILYCDSTLFNLSNCCIIFNSEHWSTDTGKMFVTAFFNEMWKRNKNLYCSVSRLSLLGVIRARVAGVSANSIFFWHSLRWIVGLSLLVKLWYLFPIV